MKKQGYNKRYKLTYQDGQGNGRWRKTYKGKIYYFARREGESKDESHARCWKEFEEKKKEIDRESLGVEPWRLALLERIDNVRQRMIELQNNDTVENRQLWTLKAAELANYQSFLDNGINPFGSGEVTTEVPRGLTFEAGSELDEFPPPWATSNPVEAARTLGENVKRFMDRQERQVSRGKLSPGRFDALRLALECFVAFVGEKQPIETVNGSTLSRYRDEVESLVDKPKDKGGISAYTGRDRLAIVAQFTRWAWQEELIGLPRILEAKREFTIALPTPEVKVFTDAELKRLLADASERTRLYILLMLNCGFQQTDIAELRQDEVDWKRGYVSRKRAKTRDHESVPTVTYKLWDVTFELLKQYRSESKQYPELALTNENGKPLKTMEVVNGKQRIIDNIRKGYQRLQEKIRNSKTAPMKIDKPLKLLRKTAASKLGESSEYARFVQHFLCHSSGRTVADKFYVKPNQDQFDAAIEWLGQVLGIVEGESKGKDKSQGKAKHAGK